MAKTRFGTSYFVSMAAAVRYYRPIEGSDAEMAVDRKLGDCEIHIGKPPIEKGERLVVIDEGMRYAIEVDGPTS